MTPQQRIAAECTKRGRDEVVAGCIAVLAGRDTDDALIAVLGGGHGRWLLNAGVPADQAYWLRVWAARGLLWVWDDSATAAVVTGLGDPAWRVREMAAKVVAKHLVGDALAAVADLRGDPVRRVRAAAARAVIRLTAAGL